MWKPIIVTAESSTRGELELELFAPAQVCEPEEKAVLRQLKLIRHF